MRPLTATACAGVLTETDDVDDGGGGDAHDDEHDDCEDAVAAVEAAVLERHHRIEADFHVLHVLRSCC